MPGHDRATVHAPSSISHDAAGSPVPENDTQHRMRSGTLSSLAGSPPHRPQCTQLHISFPRSRRHRTQRETATEAGDSDREADDEGPENMRRVELSYEGTLWAFEKMVENGWIDAKDYRTACEQERPRPAEPRPAPLRAEFPFGSGRLNSVRAIPPSTRVSTTPQISPRSNEVPPENQRQAPPIWQPSPRFMDAVAVANPSARRAAYSQLFPELNEVTPARMPPHAQIVPALNELQPENPRGQLSIWPPLPWFHE